MRVFVTGATGFIGGVVARRLRERGDEVVALVRSPAGADRLRKLGAELVAGDLDDEAAIRIGTERAEAVVHAAAIYRVGIPTSERGRVHDVNVRGTERVLDAAIAAGTPRIVYVSTINVFGNTRGRIVDEGFQRDLDQGFLSTYDETKYLAHRAAEQRIEAGAPIIVVQPGAVYGPGDTSELGGQIDRARRGRLPFISFASTGVVMCHVEDVADGIVRALDTGQIGRSYVLGGEVTTFKELFRLAARCAGRRPPRVSLPSWAIRAAIPAAPVVTRVMRMSPNLRELVRVSDGVTYWASDRRAREELGYHPRDLRTGLEQVAATP